MKHFFKAFALILALLIVPNISMAAEFRAGEQPSIGKDEIIGGDMYVAGGSVTSAGAITGDLVTGGGNVLVTGNVGGDVMLGGGNVSILSDVNDDVRAAGGTILIQGKIVGDAILGGGQIILGGAGVGGDAVIGGGTVRIEAPISGNLFVGGGNVYINAPVQGNVKINADKITLGKNAVIAGNMTYVSKAEMVKEAGAVVQGTVDFTLRENKMPSPETTAALFSIFLAWKFLTLLVCALLAGLVLRRLSTRVVTGAVSRPIFELGRGVVAFAALPTLAILLFVTLVGIPFGALALLSFAMLMMFAWLLSPIILGSVVWRYFSKGELEVSWKTIFLGVILYLLLCAVPFLGFLAKILLGFISLGSLVAVILPTLNEWRKEGR